MDLEEAYDHYGGRLYRHALALTGHGPDAEDAVQSVFCKLAKRFARGRIRDVEAYLHTAVRREALRILSRRKRLLNIEVAPQFVIGVNGAAPGETEALNRALLRLPAEQREVLELHVWDGMTFRRIGDLLEISPDTAASRYRYACEKLREWLHGSS